MVPNKISIVIVYIVKDSKITMICLQIRIARTCKNKTRSSIDLPFSPANLSPHLTM